MGAESKIEWTDHTFNAWWGCVRVSPGCEHCYAESFAKRTGHKVWGVDAPRRFFGDKHWKEPIKWNAEAKSSGIRRRVFCGSMMDLFERPRNPETLASLNFEREKLWLLIEDTPDLDWLLLTKRPENASDCLPSDWLENGLPGNIWMGTTVEDQARAEARIPHLLRIPARIRFLSCEPLIGAVDLRGVPANFDGAKGDYFDALSGCEYYGQDEPDGAKEPSDPVARHPPIDWVIVGGESGTGARPMQLDWMRSLVQQCHDAGTACFVKQFGARPMFSQTEGYSRAIRGEAVRLLDRKGGDLTEIQGDWTREFPR